MCQSEGDQPDKADDEFINESDEHWRTKLREAEAAVFRLSARLRRREQRILLLERALARTVALHHSLEDSLEQRLDQCLGPLDRALERARAETNSTDRPRGGVTVRLPHLTRTLAVLFDVMWDYWLEWDPERPPKSSIVARAIDTRLGLKGQTTGEASRSAQTFAAALRPESVSDSDGRHH